MFKKTSIILLTVIMLTSSVLAQTTNVQKEDPGTTPDSPFYFLDVAMDNLALAMTFNTDAKIKKELEIMRERLAEINAMADKKDINAVSKAEKEHDLTLNKLESELKNLEGKDATEKLKKQVIAEKEIKKHKEKVQKVNEELKVKIIINGNPTQEQKDLLNSIMNNLEGKTANIEILLQNEKESSKSEVEKETGKNADDLEKEIEEEVDNEKPELVEKPENENHDNESEMEDEMEDSENKNHDNESEMEDEMEDSENKKSGSDNEDSENKKSSDEEND